MKHLVYVHADESCLGNRRDKPSRGGAGGLIEHARGAEWIRRDYWVSEPATTNNRMALRSAIEPLRLLRPCRVIFRSDSEYLVKGTREWLPAWIERGWRRKAGPVENEDLWRELAAELMRHQVDPRYVRGHAGDPHNEYANWLAIRAAREQSESDGLRPSGFLDWLERKRERGHFLDFNDWVIEEDRDFRPARLPAK